MRSHRPGAMRLPALFAVISLLLVGTATACTRQPTDQEKETAIAELLTVQPGIAQTLTAWPTPPPLRTLPPTATAAPQPLWTATPTPAADALPPSPTPEPTKLGATTVTGTTNLPGTLPVVGSSPPPVRILIPGLDLDVPVVEVSWDVVEEDGTWKSVWQTADNAAGHHRDSANPGEAGNVVISGHHNIQGEVFRQVSEIGQPGTNLRQGDEIVLVAQDGRQHTYVVVTWERIAEDGASQEERQRHAEYLAPTPDATLTLVTCWPYESNTHRVVVIAKLQPSE